MDSQVSKLKRALFSDPENQALKLRLQSTLRRLYGPDIEQHLSDHSRWRSLDSELQDAIIAHVASRLLPDIQWFETKTYHCAGLSFRLARFKHSATGLVMHLLPGGSFLMGALSSRPEEAPVTEERVAPFLLSQSPLTGAEWNAIQPDDEPLNLPKARVSWYESRVWLTAAGDGLRLPFEREWEYACRAGSEGDYYWGPDFDDAYCWSQRNSDRQRQDPKQHLDKTNAFGLIDMLGNVWEWCEDCYFLNRKSKNPALNRSYRFYCLRGGCAKDTPLHCRAARREGASPRLRSRRIGFRVARSLPPIVR